MHATLRRLTLSVLAVAALAISGCAGGGYSRGLFQGFVVNKTEAQIIEQMGKPVEIDRKNPDAPVLVYKEKTFDENNGNRVDPETLVYLRKDEKSGSIVAYDLSFRG